MYCKKCGAFLSDNSVRCTECGEVVGKLSEGDQAHTGGNMASSALSRPLPVSVTEIGGGWIAALKVIAFLEILGVVFATGYVAYQLLDNYNISFAIALFLGPILGLIPLAKIMVRLDAATNLMELNANAKRILNEMRK